MEFNHDRFWASFRAQEAAEKLKEEAINNILIKGFPQSGLAEFMKTGVAPTGRPELPPALREVTPQFLSDIIVALMVKKGNLPSLTELCFSIQLTTMGADRHSEINRLWRALIDHKEKFFLIGTPLLKSFMLAVKEAYFTGMDADAFVAAVLSETDPYFHGMVKKVFEEQMFARGGVLVGGK
jgi:hypothetical protein